MKQHDKRIDHLLTDGLGAEVRRLSVRVARLEAAKSSRQLRKKN